MAVELHEKPDNHGAGWVIALVVITLMLFFTAKCHAADQVVVDTMVCKTECIQKIIQRPSANGKTTKFYAVYNDPKINFSEIIPVSKTVMDYIEMCKSAGIKPTLGIKLRNGVVSCIVRYKIKFVKR